LFGGIIEITKESDEVYIYQIETNKWSLVDTSNTPHGHNEMN
jgi:Galactose oxidase, central domain